MHDSSLQFRPNLAKRARLCNNITARAGTVKGASFDQHSFATGMLGLRLGTASALRGSARTTVVAQASPEPSESGIRKLARSATLPLSVRIQQLRSLVPGAGPTSLPRTEQQPSSVTSDSDRPSLPSSDIAEHTNSEARTAPASASGRSTQRLNHPAPHHRNAHPQRGGSSHRHAHHPSEQRQPHHRQQPAPETSSHSTHTRTRHHHHHHQPRARLSTATTHPSEALLQHQQRLLHLSQHSHPTLQMIASRVRSGSKPGARADGAKLGLVVEGGGMRGCISGAMLMGLLELGLADAFDAVYGASAGAINATYYLSGQRHGLRIYSEDLTQGNCFLDFRNLFSRSSARPVMNIDFLIDQVMNTSKPLDWEAVLASPTPLKVVASCLDSLEPVLLSDFKDRYELAEALKATAAVPQLAGPPRRLRGRTLVDAAVFESVPVPSAIRDGCTHVLVLCTRPPPVRKSPWEDRVRTTIEVLAKTTVLNAPYMREAWRVAESADVPYEQLVSALQLCPHEYQSSAGAFVLPLFPESTAGCHPLSRDPATLLAACEVGRGAAHRMLGPVVVAAAAEAGAAPAGVTPTWEMTGRPAGVAGFVYDEAAEAVVVAGEDGAVEALEGQWVGGEAKKDAGEPRGGSGVTEIYTPQMDLRFRP